MLKKSIKVILTILETVLTIFIILLAPGIITANDFEVLSRYQLTSEGMIEMAEILFTVILIVALVFLYCSRAWRSINIVKSNIYEVQKESEALHKILHKVS